MSDFPKKMLDSAVGFGKMEALVSPPSGGTRQLELARTNHTHPKEVQCG
jgi:hypothetical protein